MMVPSRLGTELIDNGPQPTGRCTCTTIPHGSSGELNELREELIQLRAMQDRAVKILTTPTLEGHEDILREVLGDDEAS